MIYVTYAGAGGGKTTEMISQVRLAMEGLHPSRFVCVITYTNEAAKDIKNMLVLSTNNLDNVFIGTIHSFLLRFVVKPHLIDGANLSVVSQISVSDKHFDGFKVWAKSKISDAQKRDIVIRNKARERKNAIYAKLISKNLISNDQIVEVAKELISRKLVKEAVSRKIQYLFVDEYQDTYRWQHDIFESIHKGKRTDWYAIGDPNQSIYNFAYSTSENDARKPKSYEDFPICKLQRKCKPENYKVLNVNFRSTKEIVDFANLYNQDFQQISKFGGFAPVLAFSESNPSLLYKKFHKHRADLKLSDSVFFISRENQSLTRFKQEISLEFKALNSVREIETFILQIVGMSKREFCEVNCISLFQLRTLAIICEPLRELSLESISMNFETKFERPLISNELDIEKPKAVETMSYGNERFLTIHKSKGLEAESVLVVFKTNKELEKLLVEKSLMRSASTDDLRLGYVAFTRAKRLLGICCLENLSAGNKALLNEFGLSLV